MGCGKSVTVCVNHRANPAVPSCAARGGAEIAQALESAVAVRGLPVTVERFNCLGRCAQGPNLKLSPGGEFRHAVHLVDVSQVLDTIAAFAEDLE